MEIERNIISLLSFKSTSLFPRRHLSTIHANFTAISAASRALL